MVPGMGIQFMAVDEGKRRELDEFVTRLRREFGES
jgi:c-di-GMP-binding flagellar brake protein YcgR